MLRIYFVLSMFLLLPASLCTQNIIPNGSFETLSSFTCPQDPITGFRTVESWMSYGTPHLWVDGCPYDEEIWHFWERTSTALHGINSIGLGGSLFVDGNFSSVSMGAQLTKLMEAGRDYYLQFNVRNRGIWHRFPDSLKVCETDPPKRIHVSFGDRDLLEPEEFYLRMPEFNFTSAEIQSPERSNWMQVQHCFEAADNYSDFAISGGIGPTNMSLPCEVRTLDRDPNYYIYHFDFDDLILYPVPERIDTVFRSCEIGEIEIDLMRLAQVPLRVEVEFDWSDGFVGGKRNLSEAGVYQIEAKLSCISFPIEITVAEDDCTPDFFAPNIFSPNGDGVNDEFVPVVRADHAIQNYVLAIFDRWGTKVFETNNLNDAWDGRINGNPLPIGVYVWAMQFELVSERDVRQIVKSEEVVLIR